MLLLVKCSASYTSSSLRKTAKQEQVGCGSNLRTRCNQDRGHVTVERDLKKRATQDSGSLGSGAPGGGDVDERVRL
jgi:hypothetical protein